MNSLASRLHEFMTYVGIIEHIIRLNALSASTNKIVLLPSSLNTELKACTAASHLHFLECFLKVVITARPGILLITSPIPIGLTQGFLSKGISLHAKNVPRDPSFPQYLFKHNFFRMSAIALQRSRLLSPNNEVRMRHHPFASRFDGSAVALILCAILYIRAPFISLYAYSSYNSSWSCSKMSSHFGAHTGCFSLRRSTVCLLVGGIPALSVSERSLKAAFTFQIT